MGLMDQLSQGRGFPREPPQSSIAALVDMAKGNPQALMSQLMRTNPTFKAFAEQNAGKTPEQAFSEHGLDFNQFKGLFN